MSKFSNGELVECTFPRKTLVGAIMHASDKTADYYAVFFGLNPANDDKDAPLVLTTMEVHENLMRRPPPQTFHTPYGIR